MTKRPFFYSNDLILISEHLLLPVLHLHRGERAWESLWNIFLKTPTTEVVGNCTHHTVPARESVATVQSLQHTSTTPVRYRSSPWLTRFPTGSRYLLTPLNYFTCLWNILFSTSLGNTTINLYYTFWRMPGLKLYQRQAQNTVRNKFLEQKV